MRMDRLLWLSCLSLAACTGLAENLAPVAASDVARVDEDRPAVVDVLANDGDPDGDPLTVVAVTAPEGSRASTDGRNVLFAPPADFTGTLTLRYQISDGEAVADGDVSIIVRPVDDAPVAHPASYDIEADQPGMIVLPATDIDGDTMQFEIVEAPAHGAVTGDGALRMFVPETHYVGPDHFTFRAIAQGVSSAPARVDLTIATGHTPRAMDLHALVREDAAVDIALSGTDPDGDALSFVVVTEPAHGALSGATPNLTYTPVADFYGLDSFTYVVRDGEHVSAAATVSIAIEPVADTPVADADAVTTVEDQSRTIALVGHDADGDALTATVVTGPAHGTLSGGGMLPFYTPARDFVGEDTVTFTVSDGTTTSAPATITVTVTPVDDAPVAIGRTVAVTEDLPATFAMPAVDVDGEALTYAITGAPAHGTLAGAAPAFTYTPSPDYFGPDTLTYTVDDGHHVSSPATVTFNVAAINDPPVAPPRTITLAEDTPATFTLAGTDVDSANLTVSIVAPPAHGSLGPNGASGSYGYIPAVDYHGPDQFTYGISDGAITTTAVVTLAITAVNDAPRGVEDISQGAAGAAQTIAVLDNDVEVDGETLSIDSATAPAHGDIEIDGATLIYTPDDGFVGTETLTYTMDDGTGLQATAVVRIGVGQFPAGVAAAAITQVDTAASVFDVSDDGRLIAFTTGRAVVPSDTNNLSDVYVYDRLARSFERISVANDGAQVTGTSTSPSISPDGRYVAFVSSAPTLVAGDTNGRADVFVRDRVAHTTVRVSVAGDGAQATGASGTPSISDDGQRVAFLSNAYDLVPDDANGAIDVFVRDLAAGTTVRASVSATGQEADLPTTAATLSGDGKVVVFVSAATNLVTGDANGVDDVFARVLATGAIERLSVSSTGGEANGASRAPSVSRDGRFVAFESQATSLLPVPSAIARIYVRDRDHATTTTPFSVSSTAWTAPSLSADGRYVAAYNGSYPYVADRLAGGMSQLANTARTPTILSGNGRYIVSETYATSGPFTLYASPNPR